MSFRPETAPATRSSRRVERKRTAKRPRGRVTVVGVIGELLITVGVLVMLFLVWQLWINDEILRAEQDDRAASLTEQWAAAAAPTPTDASEIDMTPVVLDQPDDAEKFAVLRVPRFGENYQAELAGGVSKARTLDPIGIGHYPTTAMPGEVGNFALAGHRNTHGKPLNLVGTLHVGDAIVVEIEEGWYTYRFRTLEYVLPTAVGVLNPVPQVDGALATDALITLTSCNPAFSQAERIIAYGVFESWTPRAAGPPTSLTEGAK